MDRRTGCRWCSGRPAGRAARSWTSWCARAGGSGRWAGARSRASRPGSSRCAPTCTTRPTPLGPIAGASVVYHAAQPPYEAWDGNFERLNEAIADATAAAGARLVFADNLYMYGPGSSPMTEATPQRATDRKGAQRIRLAADLLARHERGELEVAIGRSATTSGRTARTPGRGSGCSGRRSRARRRVPSAHGRPALAQLPPGPGPRDDHPGRPRRGGRTRLAPAGDRSASRCASSSSASTPRSGRR